MVELTNDNGEFVQLFSGGFVIVGDSTGDYGPPRQFAISKEKAAELYNELVLGIDQGNQPTIAGGM